jgi:hypothetical protein
MAAAPTENPGAPCDHIECVSILTAVRPVARQNAILVESWSVHVHARQRMRGCMSRDRHADTPLPSFVFHFVGNTRTRVMQPHHSDDGDHRASVWIELYNLHLDSLPLPGPLEFLSPVQDGFDPRDNSGHTRSSAV